jgi:polyisoprenoid-binding protein YceI
MRRQCILGVWSSLFAAVLCFGEYRHAAAAETDPGRSGEERVVLEAGDLELASSQVLVFVGKTGFGHEHAVSGKLASGHLDLDPSAPVGELVFDLSSFDADSEGARRYLGLEGKSDDDTRRQVNENMRGKAVLDVEKYATATFTLTSVKPLRELSVRKQPQIELLGDLTLHGVKREVRVVAEQEEKQGWIHLRGGFRLLQTDFGITPFSKAFGAVGVTDELDVWGDFWIAKDRRVLEAKKTTTSRGRK